MMSESQPLGPVSAGHSEEIGPWDEFVDWAKKLYLREPGVPSFEEDERGYKLEISRNLVLAREALLGDAPDWPQKLKKAFGSPNNLTFYIDHSRFLDWVNANPEEARSALLALWQDSEGSEVDVDRFAQALPDSLSTGSRVQLASFLLMTEPTTRPMYRPSPMKSAAALVEHGEFPNEPPSAVYQHTLDFLDRVIDEARARGLNLRDRLDAQGLVFAMTKTEPERMGWPPEDATAFRQFRGEKPSTWWVNQGATYSQEREHGMVSAPLNSVFGHHKNVSRLRKGDVIIHHANGQIRALSQVTHKPTTGPRPWEAEGESQRIAQTRYRELKDPIVVREIDEQRRIEEGGPFDRYGGVKQVYLVPVPVTTSEWLRNEYVNRWPDGSTWEIERRNTWLFQANPDLFDLADWLARADSQPDGQFTLSRFKTELGIGDRVILWQSGKQAGAYALAEVTGDVAERAPEEEHYTSAEVELAVPIRLTQVLETPILRKNLLDHPILSGLAVITQPQGTNFKVTDEQWNEFEKLIGNVDQQPGPAEADLTEIALHIAHLGLTIDDRLLRRFHLSLQTRGFVILSGVSGTGKTWLTEAYAEAIGARYLLVPVAPNWTTNEDLLGYLNPIDGYYHDTAFSYFLEEAAEEHAKAIKEQRKPMPFILTLDEMNLARIEYYFAKFLSAMEVRSRRGVAEIELSPDISLSLTPNLLFVGTVNVDETTHGFADKVFDRAQLIELEVDRMSLSKHIGQAAYHDQILDAYDAVAEAKPFAYRVIDEIKSYIGESEALNVPWHDALDEQVLQKILTKLTGADPAVRFALERLVEIATEHHWEITLRKAERMLHDYDRDGFTSFF